MSDESQQIRAQEPTDNTNWTNRNWLKIAGVVASPLIAIVAILGLILTQINVAKQLEHAKNATQLQWRPYLNIEHISPRGYSFEYLLTGPETGDTLIRKLSDINIESDGYRAVSAIRHHFTRKIRYSNTGATPLRVTHIVSTTISQDDWLNHYEKDLSKLVAALRKSENFGLQLETDITVKPGGSVDGSSPLGEFGVVSKTYWTTNVQQNHNIVLYPVTYVEYEDFFDNTYDVVNMEFLRVSLPIRDGIVVDADTLALTPGTERYRWDVAVGSSVQSE